MADSQADTISAISTPAGEGGIGIVRMSGPLCLDIATKIFKHRTVIKPRRLHYGFIIDPDSNEEIDEVLLSYMPGPNTYTRQDVVEINCHGGMVPLGRVLELTLRHGARLARAGEFTMRAFLNGRIDLAQAEAIIDIIRAKTEASERLAISQLMGGLSKKVASIRESLINACALMEAHLDFAEDDIGQMDKSNLKSTIESAMLEIGALIESFKQGRRFREGIKTAIAGKPNVGKSSLLNALLMRDRAIVTEHPGTTRDTIEEYIDINGLPLVLIDTAGIRESHDLAEQEGVRRSLDAIEGADLVLFVADGSKPLSKSDYDVLEKATKKDHILINNKCDLKNNIAGSGFLSVSAKTGEGLDSLKREIYGRFSASNKGEGIMVTNLRHKTVLEHANRSLVAALQALDVHPLEIAAIEIKDAADALIGILGALTPDEVLDRIFSEFCIGK